MTHATDPMTFLRHESGAITVDWTVLTAMGFSLALASLAVWSGAIDAVSDDVNVELFEMKADEGANGFDFGADGWEGVEATFVDGFGYVLGPIAGSHGAKSVTHIIDLPPGLASTTVTFDVLALDSLDNEDFVIYVEGHEVGRITSGYELSYSATPVEGVEIAINFDASILAERQNLGGSRDAVGESDWWWHDSAAAVTITLNDPDQAVEIGFGSTADQEVTDESWGVDNFGVAGSWTERAETLTSVPAGTVTTTASPSGGPSTTTDTPSEDPQTTGTTSSNDNEVGDLELGGG